MDEEEYDLYLEQIDDLYWGNNNLAEESLQEQLRDENGLRVPGCYRTVPAPTD